MMREAQRGTTVEKQPNSRMCFVCGIDNAAGLHLKFYTGDEGRCIARFPVSDRQGRATPNRSTRATRRSCTGA